MSKYTLIAKEAKSCYASVNQRQVLIELASNPVIAEQFFLTGGTLLSVFYLHHRTSEDIDLFTVESVDFGDILFWIRTRWPNDFTLIRTSPQFLSLLIHNVKVDMVYDHLSSKNKRELFEWEEGNALMLDTLMNVASNKLCALVSRVEPKDFIDLYFLYQRLSDLKNEDLYQICRNKDLIFEDPATCAYQIEAGVRFLREHESLLPHLERGMKLGHFYKFYEDLIRYFYDLFRPDQTVI